MGDMIIDGLSGLTSFLPLQFTRCKDGLFPTFRLAFAPAFAWAVVPVGELRADDPPVGISSFSRAAASFAAMPANPSSSDLWESPKDVDSGTSGATLPLPPLALSGSCVRAEKWFRVFWVFIFMEQNGAAQEVIPRFKINNTFFKEVVADVYNIAKGVIAEKIAV